LTPAEPRPKTSSPRLRRGRPGSRKPRCRAGPGLPLYAPCEVGASQSGDRVARTNQAKPARIRGVPKKKPRCEPIDVGITVMAIGLITAMATEPTRIMATATGHTVITATAGDQASPSVSDEAGANNLDCEQLCCHVTRKGRLPILGNFVADVSSPGPLKKKPRGCDRG
jgi:hypothetical protein